MHWRSGKLEKGTKHLQCQEDERYLDSLVIIERRGRESGNVTSPEAAEQSARSQGLQHAPDFADAAEAATRVSRGGLAVTFHPLAGAPASLHGP